MTPEKLAIARQMLDAGTSKAVVAKTIGVSRPTLYLHSDGRGGPIADAGGSGAISGP